MDFDIQLDYNRLYISNKKVYLDFNLSIINFTDKKIKEEEIKRKLNQGEYIKIVNFNNKKVKYEFLLSKWLKDSCPNTIQDTVDRFEKKIKLNKLPTFISLYVEPLELIKLVECEFRNLLDKNSKLKNNLRNCIKTNIKLTPSHFKFTYDSYMNYILISLRPEFRINPLLFINKEKKEVKKINFDKSVRKILGIN